MLTFISRSPQIFIFSDTQQSQIWRIKVEPPFFRFPCKTFLQMSRLDSQEFCGKENVLIRDAENLDDFFTGSGLSKRKK
jgi:hypothetical protein